MHKLIYSIILISTILFSSTIQTGIVKKIVDGDTLKTYKHNIRFAYIDTPESKRNKRAKKFANQCKGITLNTIIKAGKLSSSFTKSLVSKGDKIKFNIIDTDRYNRKVAIIYNNQVNINEELISQGYAVPYYQYIPFTLKRKYKKLNQQAKSNNRGLYKIYPQVMRCLEN